MLCNNEPTKFSKTKSRVSKLNLKVSERLEIEENSTKLNAEMSELQTLK